MTAKDKKNIKKTIHKYLNSYVYFRMNIPKKAEI